MMAPQQRSRNYAERFLKSILHMALLFCFMWAVDLYIIAHLAKISDLDWFLCWMGGTLAYIAFVLAGRKLFPGSWFFSR